MNEVKEAVDIIDNCIKSLVEISDELKKLRNWLGATPEVKKEPSKEAQESLDAWLGDDY